MIIFLASALLQEPTLPAVDPYERAVEERRAGHSKEAVRLLRELSQSQPGNADVWLQLGYALRDEGDHPAASRAFQKALSIAPDYEDAKVGLASENVADPAASISLLLDASLTAVRRNPDWREIKAGVALPASARLRVQGSIEHSRRFGRTDTYLETRVDARPSSGSSAYLAFGGTAAADYRPELQVLFGGSQRLGKNQDPFLMTLDGGLAKYPDGTVWTLSPGFQKYVADGSAWISAKWVNIGSDAGHYSGGMGRLDVATGLHSRLFVGGARAPDLSEGRAIPTTSFFGGAVVEVNDRIDWRGSIARDLPRGGSARLTISTGLSLRLP